MGKHNRCWMVGLFGEMAGLVVMVLLPSLARAENQVIEMWGGTASVERDDHRIEAVQVGTELWVGDLLRPASGTVVKVQCDNHTTRQVRHVSGLGRICPDSVARRRTHTGRGENDFLSFLFGTFDYGTQVMEAMPTLRWERVEGATTYRVQVWSGEEMLWDTVEAGTQVLYGGAGLEVGQRYQMIVTALAGDEEVGRSRLLLRRLTPEEADRVTALVERMAVEDLGGEGRSLVLTQVYLDVAAPLLDPPEGSGLIWAGIEELEALVAQGNETPFTHQVLGDLYLQVGLLGRAQVQYERVLELTREQDDVRTRVAAWVGLANSAAARSAIAYEFGHERAVAVAEAEAREYLEFAVINYRVLGEVSRVENIEDEWLSKIKP